VGDNSLFWLQPEPGQLGQNVLFPDDEIAQLPALLPVPDEQCFVAG
jgi:hypothetical protein